MNDAKCYSWQIQFNRLKTLIVQVAEFNAESVSLHLYWPLAILAGLQQMIGFVAFAYHSLDVFHRQLNLLE